MLSLSPAEIGGWRAHFERYPPDGAERLLSRLVRLTLAEDPGEEVIRPWAFTPREAARMKALREAELARRKQEEADRKLTEWMRG